MFAAPTDILVLVVFEACKFTRVLLSVVTPGRTHAQRVALIDKQIHPGCIVICHHGIRNADPPSPASHADPHGFPVVYKDLI